MTSPSIIPKIPAIISELMDAVQTDLSFREILGLAGALRDAQKNGLDMEMVPGKPLYIDGVSYWIPDVEMLRLSIADALGIHVDPALRERFERAANEYKDSIPSNAADVPEGDNSIGNAVRSSREHIRDRSSGSYNTNRQYYDTNRNGDYPDGRSDLNSDRNTSDDSRISDSDETYRRHDSRSDGYSTRNESRDTDNNINRRIDENYSNRSLPNDINSSTLTENDDYTAPSRSNDMGKTR